MDTYFGYVWSDLGLEDKILGQDYYTPFGHTQVWDIFRFKKGGKKLWPRLDVNRQTGGRTGSDSLVLTLLVGKGWGYNDLNLRTQWINFC